MSMPSPQQIAATASVTYQSPNSYENQEVFKTPSRRTSHPNSGAPYESPVGDLPTTPKQTTTQRLRSRGGRGGICPPWILRITYFY